jgi:hypothetical protein
MAAIGFNVKISGVWRFLTKMANGNLSPTARNYRSLSIFAPLNESISATTSDKSKTGPVIPASIAGVTRKVW